MSEDQATAKLAGRWGELALDAAREDILVADLRAQIERLQVDNDTVTRDLEHALCCRQACAKNLREAREKNRLLWDKLSAREQGGS